MNYLIKIFILFLVNINVLYAGDISEERTLGIEISQDGAASAFVTVTVNVNNTL